MTPAGAQISLQNGGPGGPRGPSHPSARVAGDEVRPQVEQRPRRQPDDVEVVALDALDERAAATLDRVAARALLPLAALEVPLDRAVVERAEGDLRDRRRRADRAVLVNERDAAHDVVRSAAQVAQGVARGVLVGRLAPDLDPGRDKRVDAEHDLAGGRAACDRLAQRVL